MIGFHLKLHPGIVYSHAASQICPPPVLIGMNIDTDENRNTDTNTDENSTSGVTHIEYLIAGIEDWQIFYAYVCVYMYIRA